MSDNSNMEKALNEINAEISEKLPDNPNLQSIQEFYDLCLISNQEVLARSVEQIRNDENCKLIVPEIFIKLYSNDFFKSEITNCLKYLDNFCLQIPNHEKGEKNYCFSKLDVLTKQGNIYTQEVNFENLENEDFYSNVFCTTVPAKQNGKANGCGGDVYINPSNTTTTSFHEICHVNQYLNNNLYGYPREIGCSFEWAMENETQANLFGKICNMLLFIKACKILNVNSNEMEYLSNIRNTIETTLFENGYGLKINGGYFDCPILLDLISNNLSNIENLNNFINYFIDEQTNEIDYSKIYNYTLELTRERIQFYKENHSCIFNKEFMLQQGVDIEKYDMTGENINNLKNFIENNKQPIENDPFFEDIKKSETYYNSIDRNEIYCRKLLDNIYRYLSTNYSICDIPAIEAKLSKPFEVELTEDTRYMELKQKKLDGRILNEKEQEQLSRYDLYYENNGDNECYRSFKERQRQKLERLNNMKLRNIERRNDILTNFFELVSREPIGTTVRHRETETSTPTPSFTKNLTITNPSH